MKADDLISFFIEEAQHQVINDECTKNTESALAAHGKNPKKGKFCQKKNITTADGCTLRAVGVGDIHI